MNNTLTPPLSFADDLLEKLAAGHSAEQQLWLSGYLYGLAAAGHSSIKVNGAANGIPRATPTRPSTENGAQKQLTILYGSQTGNSRKVASRMAEHFQETGWKLTLTDLNDYPVKSLSSEKVVLLVVSTQGEGEPPVSAEEFHRGLLGPRAPQLTGLQYAVCALGDRAYLNFCQTGRELDERLAALGATRLTERVECDVDFEAAAEAWMAQVVDRLGPYWSDDRGLSDKGALRSDDPRSSDRYNHNGQAAHFKPAVETEPAYSRKNPYPATILEKIQLHGRGSAKETWHLELSLAGADFDYEPGDALGIYPENSDSAVREVLYAAMLNGSKKLIFNEKENTLRYILRSELELNILSRDVLERYAAWTKSTRLNALLQDQEALKTYLWGRGVADLFREFPAALSEATLLTILRPLQPRLYSIASSLSAHPEEAHLTVAALRYDFLNRPRQGTASAFLADRVQAGDEVRVFLERNEYFKLPADPGASIIMVGPGTGIAPFRAFVQERAEARAGTTRPPGKNWLFFGNPHFDTDFLYQKEWLQQLKRGTLDRLDVAFSRDQPEKVYVQHRLLERSRLIYERLEEGAYFYVCGDKARMAPDVRAALLALIEKESGKGAEYATEYVQRLKKERRFLEDVY